MMNFEQLTIILVSFKLNEKLLEKILKDLSPKFKVIIIENSHNKKLKDYERKFNNLEVFLSNENKGNGAGINQGLKLTKTRYALYIDADVEISVNHVIRFIETANELDDFTVLIPNLNNKFNIKAKQECYTFTGAVMFFNLVNLKNIEIFDENIFLYFEETDFAFRCKKLNKKIFMVPSINITHKESTSIKVDANKNEKLKSLRQWHFMWSKFYFYKKNYNYFFAFVKTYRDFIESFLKLIVLFPFNRRKSYLHSSRLLGLICSMIGVKSYKRLD